jgi:hypothetical protein
MAWNADSSAWHRIRPAPDEERDGMSIYFDADAVQQRYRELDADRLMLIALSATDAYAEEAILLAREELERRGIHDARFGRRPSATSPVPASTTVAQEALPVFMKVLCVLLPGIAIFVALGYALSGRRSKGVEALFLMVVGWFLWFVAANLMRTL